MNTTTIKFIVTTTFLLKRLIKIDMSTEHSCDVKFEVKDDIITIDDSEYIQVNACDGAGVFFYDKRDVKKLIKCLRSLDEQPITMIFSNNIWIQNILF